MHKGPYHPRLVPVEGHQCRKHPLYHVWAGMFSRCENPHDTSYRNYGGRGVTVCERWYEFKNFLKDMGPKPSPEHELDRIDVDGHYEPGNCRWATRSEQMLNRRKFKNARLESRGVVQRRSSYQARMDFEGKRYIIGYYPTEEEAAQARETFEWLFFRDRPAAMAYIRKGAARINSSTGVRGVTPHVDGGYTVRVTINGKRRYLGYFKELDDAIAARNRAVGN